MNKKSIFEYQTDASKFVNGNECKDFTPPFLSYMPHGVPPKNLDVESDLKGMTRMKSKCDNAKYCANLDLIQSKIKKIQFNDKECTDDFKILPFGYYFSK